MPCGVRRAAEALAAPKRAQGLKNRNTKPLVREFK
jgi:hypothetical protein